MSILYRDTTLTKIFVGGLPYHTTDESLQKFFDQFGAIEEAVVITDRHSGKSKGYGFVTMADRVGAERACKDPNPIIDGRKANVNLAYLGAKPRLQAGELLCKSLHSLHVSFVRLCFVCYRMQSPPFHHGGNVVVNSNTNSFKYLIHNIIIATIISLF
ncbi:hypothetical protein HELRODRAFT_72885 [Helobdella robusta]|uniref:RRM domain-containing protein n=1 Tax=Helobdella robusta TaxID=6412 RepID=T1G167_HELRO|nr:hypothetical protein HELRODRAFT_72885 [Helobdella robusta]ESO10062.1 hypothetical protein HELRODRAFT_72885 [Helobdella robusta]